LKPGLFRLALSGPFREIGIAGRLLLVMAALALVAPSAAVALDLSSPHTMPLRPTAAEFRKILEASGKQPDYEPAPGAEDCLGAGFPTLHARAAAAATQGGDILAAYVQLCREAALEARLQQRRISRSRCCGG
jgi:hypothetical protein